MSTHQPDVGAVPSGGSAGTGAPHDSAQEDLRERSLPELMKQLADQTTTLLRKEIELAKAEAKEAVDTAKAEMTEKAKEAGKGAGMLGAAGVIGLLAAIAFTAFLILVLGTFIPEWLAALIVTVLYAAIAAVLALRGKTQLQQVDPTPRQTIETAKDAQRQSVESVKEDIEWAKTQSRSAKR
jgi:nitrate/nitrite transporter NarK